MLHVLILRDADECASCDEVVQELDGLKNEFPRMRVRERRLDQEEVLASRLGVVAAPAIVVNDQLAFQGHPDPGFLRTYLGNAEAGLHDDPDAYPPDDERHPDNQGQEATGSMDPEWRGSGRTPSHASTQGGRHS
jgi:hypothetical protein